MFVEFKIFQSQNALNETSHIAKKRFNDKKTVRIERLNFTMLAFDKTLKEICYPKLN